MANNLSASNAQLRANRLQRLKENNLVAMAIANMEQRVGLREGDTVHRPYYSDIQWNDYTKGIAVTAQDVTTTDEYLSINSVKEATVYIDDIDTLQNKYNMAQTYIERIGYRLNNKIDGQFLAEVSNASYTLDDGDMGGTATNPIVQNVSTLPRIFGEAQAKMFSAQIETTAPWYAVITPKMAVNLGLVNMSQGFNKADEALVNGFGGTALKGKYFDFNVYTSNNVLHTNVLTSGANYQADETVVVAGVTFTFKASPSVAGEVDVGSDEATSIANLVAAINGGTGAGSAYIALSDANRRTLKNLNIVATATTSHIITVTSSGSITTSETSANASWGTQVASCLFGKVNTIDLVIQKGVTVQQNKVPDKTGYNYLCFDLYGIKTFVEGAQRNMQVKISA